MDLSATDQLRPDLLTTLAPDQYMIDVCVTNPLCKTHLPRAANKMLGATIHAANNKIEKYRKMAQDRRMYFMPFAVETTGGWGSQAAEFINTIADCWLESRLIMHSPWNHHEELTRNHCNCDSERKCSCSHYWQLDDS